jgi:hypothetical protein
LDLADGSFEFEIERGMPQIEATILEWSDISMYRNRPQKKHIGQLSPPNHDLSFPMGPHFY